VYLISIVTAALDLYECCKDVFQVFDHPDDELESTVVISESSTPAEPLLSEEVVTLEPSILTGTTITP
jgi:hypothetical protein